MHTIKEHKGISQQLNHMKRQLADMEADTTWRGVSCMTLLPWMQTDACVTVPE